MNAIDVSNYTGPVSLQQAQQARAHGVSRAIVGLQYPAPGSGYPPGQAQQQIVSFIAAGVEVEVYFESTPVSVAWTYVGDFAQHIRRPWLAVEPGGGFETIEAIRAALAEIDALGIGRCGIYTNTWAIDTLGLDLSEFADRDLWWAGYNGLQNLDMRPIAGWQSCVMHQYAGDTEFAGIQRIDLNYYEEEEVQLESLNQSDAIKEVIEAAQAVGPDEGQWFRVVGGYTPKPGRTAYLVEVKE